MSLGNLFERGPRSPEGDLGNVPSAMLSWHALHHNILASIQTEAAFERIRQASNPSTPPDEAARLYHDADRLHKISAKHYSSAQPYEDELLSRGELEPSSLGSLENQDGTQPPELLQER